MFNDGIKRRKLRKKRKVTESAATNIRFFGFKAAVILLFVILIAQLWKLQVVEGGHFQQKAAYNRLRLVAVPPQRGIIYDRNGRLMVQNEPCFTAAVVPIDLPERQQSSVCEKLGKLLEMPPAEIEEKIRQWRAEQRFFSPVPIKTGLSEQTAFIIEEHREELPGVNLIIEPIRHYLHGPLTSHLLGYVGRISSEEYASLKNEGYDLNDRLGKTSVELWYEKQLRGTGGQEQIEVDVTGTKLRTLQTVPPRDGYNLVLTIDIDLQRKVAQLLEEGMGESEYAVAIAMNPQTGEILAAVSLPGYDNNLFSTPTNQEKLSALFNDPRRPLIDYGVSGIFPPGSIFKIVTGSAALEEGVATPQTQITSYGSIALANQYDPSIVYTFKDWAALGTLDFYRAVALSSDVYFYHLAGGYQDFKGLGSERLARYAREFGLGEPTGIDLPGENKGLVPNAGWKKDTLNEQWLTGDTYNFGIGQGYLTVTPLQMLNVVAAVANGGTLLQPQVVREVIDSNNKIVTPFDKKVIRQIPVSKQYIQVMREGMRQAVDWGTATEAKVPGVAVAGKTGTAEWGTPHPQTGDYPTHGWFLSFAPFDNPEIAVAVFVQKGRGNATAAPIAGKILKYYFGKENQ